MQQKAFYLGNVRQELQIKGAKMAAKLTEAWWKKNKPKELKDAFGIGKHLKEHEKKGAKTAKKRLETAMAAAPSHVLKQQAIAAIKAEMNVLIDKLKIFEQACRTSKDTKTKDFAQSCQDLLSTCKPEKKALRDICLKTERELESSQEDLKDLVERAKALDSRSSAYKKRTGKLGDNLSSVLDLLTKSSNIDQTNLQDAIGKYKGLQRDIDGAKRDLKRMGEDIKMIQRQARAAVDRGNPLSDHKDAAELGAILSNLEKDQKKFLSTVTELDKSIWGMGKRAVVYKAMKVWGEKEGPSKIAKIKPIKMRGSA